MTEHEIVKVQPPQFPPSAPFSIYAADKGRLTLVPRAQIPEAVIKALGTDRKGYFRATWRDEQGWELHERVADREW